MSEFINTVDVIGDDALTDSIILRTITEFKSDQVLTVGDHAFYNCPLTMMEMPNVTKVDISAFEGTALTRFCLPKATTGGGAICRNIANLVEVDLPEMTSLGGSFSFQGCPNITTVNMPKLKSTSSLTFMSTLLESVSFPAMETLGPQTFTTCTSLRWVDLPVCKKIDRSAFVNCSALGTLILRKSDGICALGNTSAFDGTPFASGGVGGIALVPKNLIASYQSGTNWSTLYTGGTCDFRALEDFTVDGTTTGVIDWDKLG